MDEHVLSALEKRVAEMEKVVFGEISPLDTKITVVEALLNAHTMIKSSLIGHDNIVHVLERLPELNEFLDPTYSNNNIEIETKRKYILLLHSELQNLGVLLKEFQRVEKVVDSDAIANTTKLSEKLDTIIANNVNTHLESTASSKQVLETINKYNDILSSLEVLLMQFDQTATQIEQEMESKKPSPDD